MSDTGPYAATAADGTVFLHHRTVPERLRYLAGKLRDDPGPLEAVALMLDMTADELEADGSGGSGCDS